VASGTADTDLAGDDEVALLIAAAKQGSGEALGRLSEALGDYLRAISQFDLDPDVRAKVGASDVVQQTLLDVHRGIAGFRGSSRREFVAWLRRLMKNNLAAIHRGFRQTAKRNVAREVALTDIARGRGAGPLADSQTPSRHAAANEEMAALDEVLARLPAHYRQVIVLRNFELRSFEQIGLAMGCSANAARKAWSRAIRDAQQELARLHA